MSAAMVVAALIASLTFPGITAAPQNASKGFIWSSALAFSTSLSSLLIFLSLAGVPTALLDWWIISFLILAVVLLHCSVIACYLALVFSLINTQFRSLSLPTGVGLRAALAILLIVPVAISIFLAAKILTAIFARGSVSPTNELQYATTAGAEREERHPVPVEGGDSCLAFGQSTELQGVTSRMQDEF